MDKKIIIFTGMIVLLCIGYIAANKIYKDVEKEEPAKYKYLKETELYKKINIDEVTKLTISKYTEAGLDSNDYTDVEEIKSTYIKLGNIRLGKKTDMACEIIQLFIHSMKMKIKQHL